MVPAVPMNAVDRSLLRIRHPLPRGEDLTQLPLSKRREVLESVVKTSGHVGLSQVADKTSAQMLRFVRSYGLEGVVAKRADSVYQPGLRTGLWSKQRVNLGQEFVTQIEFLEWTGANHLRHTKFVGLRDEKDPRKVVRERYEVTGMKVYRLNICDDQRSPFVPRNHDVASDQIE